MSSRIHPKKVAVEGDQLVLPSRRIMLSRIIRLGFKHEITHESRHHVGAAVTGFSDKNKLWGVDNHTATLEIDLDDGEQITVYGRPAGWEFTAEKSAERATGVMEIFEQLAVPTREERLRQYTSSWEKNGFFTYCGAQWRQGGTVSDGKVTVDLNQSPLRIGRSPLGS